MITLERFFVKELLPLVGIVLLFWLFIIRPTQRRQKELGRMQSSLSIGDEIMLTSGVLGTVRELTDDHVGVEIAPGVVIRVVRGAVGSKVEPTPDEAGPELRGPELHGPELHGPELHGQEQRDPQNPANGADERTEES